MIAHDARELHPEGNDTVTHNEHNERIYLRALYMCAASNQGGNSDAGREAAMALHTPFPLTMEGLEFAATRDCFDPKELWPWLFSMRADRERHHAIERRAQEIYLTFERIGHAKPPWVQGGNSDKQNEARRMARAEADNGPMKASPDQRAKET